MTPRPFRITKTHVDVVAGGVRLELTADDGEQNGGPGAADRADGGGGGGWPEPLGRTQVGQYVIVHTSAGVQVPAMTCPPSTVDHEACGGGSGLVLEVILVRVPCSSTRLFGVGAPLLLDGTGAQVHVSGPFGRGWRTSATRPLVLIGWERDLAWLAPVIEHTLASRRGPHHPQHGTGGAGGKVGMGSDGRHLDQARDFPEAPVRIWAGGRDYSAVPLQNRWAGWVAAGANVTINVGKPLTLTAAAAEVAGHLSGRPDILLAGPLESQRALAADLVDRGANPAAIQLSAHPLIACPDRRCGRCVITLTPPPSDPAAVQRLSELRACVNGPVLIFDELNPSAGAR